MHMDLSAYANRSASKTGSIRTVSYRKIGDDKNLLLDVSAHSTTAFNAVTFAEAFRAQFNGKAVVVPGTFRDVAKATNGTVYRFVAKQAKPSKPFIETANMQFLGNGQYLDIASALIWETVGEGDHARIVQSENGDLDQLLDGYRARIGVNEAMMSRKVLPRRGDYASYIKDGSLAYGFIFTGETEGKAHVVSMDTRSVETVSSDNIVSTLNPAQVGNRRGAPDIANYDVAMSVKEAKPILDYLSMLYPPEIINGYKRILGN